LAKSAIVAEWQVKIYLVTEMISEGQRLLLSQEGYGLFIPHQKRTTAGQYY
jgi:hypothetical protein